MEPQIHKVDFVFDSVPISLFAVDRFYEVIDHDKCFYEGRYLSHIFNNYNDIFNTNSPLTCLDIGACIGNHTVFFSKILKARKVYSFEPTPFSFNVLLDNIKLNDIDNCDPYNMCVSSTPGTFSIKKSVSHMIGCNEWAPDIAGNTMSTNLDFINDQIDFIKIDVEGMEMDVLSAVQPFIDKYSPVIMIEISRISGVLITQTVFDEWLDENNYKYLYPKVFNHNTYLIKRNYSS